MRTGDVGDGLSDADAVDAAENDRRWQLVLGTLGQDTSPFGQGTLVRFRVRATANDLDKKLVERTVELAKKTKKFGWKKLRVALDSSPLPGAGRVEDTAGLCPRIRRGGARTICARTHVARRGMSRGAELPGPGTSDPREDVLHQIESGCQVDLGGSCWNDFVVGVYSLDKAPHIAWHIKVTNDRPTELAAQASGAIAFDHAGRRVLIGMTDGAIEIASSPTATTVKRLHFARIVRIVVSPGDGWAFSEDAAGVQRVWKLP